MSRTVVGALFALGVIMTACKSDPPPPGPPVPTGSGDYRKTYALIHRYKEKQITLSQLEGELALRKLPPYKDGACHIFLLSAPPPPPGVTFDPRMMPRDWEGTWGEVAHVHLMGELTRDEYNQLHRAAHPNEKK